MVNIKSMKDDKTFYSIITIYFTKKMVLLGSRRRQHLNLLTAASRKGEKICTHVPKGT